jgi:hypothetical protein
MTRSMLSASGASNQSKKLPMDQREVFMESFRHVAKLCVIAAMTAPKSGGQLFLKGAKPFIEIAIVEE